jgi:hypothetical protein
VPDRPAREQTLTRRLPKLAVAAAICAIGATATRSAPAQDLVSPVPCFGAAARDPEHPCRNPSLTFTVTPTPAMARITPSPACRQRVFAPVSICFFGASPLMAADHVALVGDSHAFQWKFALEVAASARQWRGAAITRTGCALSEAVPILYGAPASQCLRWSADVLTWLTSHPEVSTVFVSNHVGGEVVTWRGKNVVETQIAGYIAAWKALPASVKHVVVLRDTPLGQAGTLACVARAQARHQRPGIACSLPRRSPPVLRADPAVVAAERLRSPRVGVVDLTRFFCDARLCYPVVGGALVYRDIGHLTATFSFSLGPFLLRALNRLLPTRPPARIPPAAPAPTMDRPYNL